jgi:hypothetical protein
VSRITPGYRPDSDSFEAIIPFLVDADLLVNGKRRRRICHPSCGSAGDICGRLLRKVMACPARTRPPACSLGRSGSLSRKRGRGGRSVGQDGVRSADGHSENAGETRGPVVRPRCCSPSWSYRVRPRSGAPVDPYVLPGGYERSGRRPCLRSGWYR